MFCTTLKFFGNILDNTQKVPTPKEVLKAHQTSWDFHIICGATAHCTIGPKLWTSPCQWPQPTLTLSPGRQGGCEQTCWQTLKTHTLSSRKDKLSYKRLNQLITKLIYF